MSRAEEGARTPDQQPPTSGASGPEGPDAGGAAVAESVLLPAHRAMLEASHIAEPVIRARGYRSVSTRAELKRLGFSDSQALVPALLIPMHGVSGGVVGYQARPDAPRLKGGKVIKYETPRGAHSRLDVPPAVRSLIADPSAPLVVTEGVKKADAAASRGLAAIGLTGVYGWRGTNELGGKTALADWESIALNDRKVYIVFDSDVMTKPQVHAALARLKAFLESKQAHVFVVYLLPGEAGVKVGLDDYFAAGGSVEGLFQLASRELRRPANEGAQESSRSYSSTPNGIVWHKLMTDGEVGVPLTNFDARIVEDAQEDDGAELRRAVVIEATIRGRVRRFTLPWGEFMAMNWPGEKLGATASVTPGVSMKDRVRAAIQELSGDPRERTVYTHTGWRLVNDEWCYLHGRGAIRAAAGAAGQTSTPASDEVLVQLPQGLEHFDLSPRGTAVDVGSAVLASLRLLELAPPTVAFPLFAAIWRSVLGPVDLSLHLTGPTGAGKSELAALAQQHFGPRFDARHLPGSWSSTGNALEVIAFTVKDALLTVDDFAPGGSATDVQRLHREADRVLRAQGNRAGRQRLRSDATLRPTRSPRGLIVSTGEDVPRGQSLRARMFVLEVSPDEILWERLTETQRDARDGRYAAAMAAFLKWLAPRYGEVREGLRGEVEAIRVAATKSGQHRRTPEIVANLVLGLRYFFRFAEEASVISAERASQLSAQAWQAIGEAAAAQAEQQHANEPARQFIDLIRSAFASGAAHLCNADGAPPDNPQMWGWRRGSELLNSAWRQQGECIGWITDEDVYLEPRTAHRLAQRLARDGGEPPLVTEPTLRRRLRDRGYLVAVDERRGVLSTRKVLGGVRRSVLQLRARTFTESVDPRGDHEVDPDQPDQDTRTGSTARDDGRVSEERWSASENGSTPKPTPESSGTRTTSEAAVGLVGPIEGKGLREYAATQRELGAWSAELPIPTGDPTGDPTGNGAAGGPDAAHGRRNGSCDDGRERKLV